MIIKNLLVIAVALASQSCSFLVDLAFYNNSNEEIEICNQNLEKPSCQSIRSKSLAKVPLVGDQPTDLWRFSIEKSGLVRAYKFGFGQYPQHASDVYCDGIFLQRCNIPVQYESNGLLYWSGKSEPLPVTKFPDQPQGFPLEPDA